MLSKHFILFSIFFYSSCEQNELFVLFFPQFTVSHNLVLNIYQAKERRYIFIISHANIYIHTHRKKERQINRGKKNLYFTLILPFNMSIHLFFHTQTHTQLSSLEIDGKKCVSVCGKAYHYVS